MKEKMDEPTGGRKDGREGRTEGKKDEWMDVRRTDGVATKPLFPS